MSKVNNEAGTKNVLDQQQQQQHQQNASNSENEESDSITDQSSSMSDHHTTTAAKCKQKTAKIGTSGLVGTQQTQSLLPPPPSTATQFSVQRSDTDGLRMKISAIRPSNNKITTVAKAAQQNVNKPKAQVVENTRKYKNPQTSDKVLNNNNNNNNTIIVEKLKIKSNSSKANQNKLLEKSAHHRQQLKASNCTTTTGAVTAGAAAAVTCVANMMMMANSARPASALSGTEAAMPPAASTTATVATKVCSGGVDATSKLGLPLAYMPQPPCLSDATESGCSEATTTTIAASSEKAAKKVKVKRKKAQYKNNGEQKKALKKARPLPELSSDSEDDKPLFLKQQQMLQKQKSQQQQQKQQQLQTQRAPRLLLTAINAKNVCAPQMKPLSSVSTATTPAHGSDHIGLSSSDNELPDLVSAAIKRVESDTDDTADTGFRKARTKNLPQYQSTLLQDFMEKTQMLGQTGATAPQQFSNNTGKSVTAMATATATIASIVACKPAPTLAAATSTTAMATSASASTSTSKQTRVEVLANSNQNANSTQSESNTSSPVVGVKKRRGRPRKNTVVEKTNLVASLGGAAAATATTVSNINESGDSGVISTTSTTQSASPPPKLAAAQTALPTGSSPQSRQRRNQQQHQQKQQQQQAVNNANTTILNDVSKPAQLGRQALCEATTSAAATATPTTSISISTTTKPKIDIAYLDKRMYATERVLYPPPRNKRRQSMSAAALQKSNSQIADKKSNATKLTKEELQLDPVWRKIDVNKKFRRPSVCGYKSDGGGGNTTICSKVLAAKSGYVSDYGSFHPRSHHHHNSGYKSDASGKSRYSTKSCASRRSRAKSCGYRSDGKESGVVSVKSSKFRRKRRCSLMKAHSKSVGNLNDEQDILQLAGLSLGQSSEESNEYVCKPSLENLPTTSVSKKYGEINRFIATGEYFGRGSSGGGTGGRAGGNGGGGSGAGGNINSTFTGLQDTNSQDGYAASSFSGKMVIPRKGAAALASEIERDILPHTSRKIKSRRSSAASYCSSYYSGTSKVRRRRRRKSFRFPNASKTAAIDSKLLTEIEIITSTFSNMCRIQSSGGSGAGSSSAGSGSGSGNSAIGGNTTAMGVAGAATGSGEKGAGNNNSSSSNKEKLLAEAGKLQNLTAAGSGAGAGETQRISKREGRDKRALKKRKMSENLDFALLSAAAASGGLTPSSGSTKRRHKKASSSSPDDHKLPLKKRHYLLTPGEKSTEAAKLFANSAEAWVAAAVVAKSTASTKSQQQFSSKSTKAGLTPKKRHLLQNIHHPDESGSNSSPLRVVVDTVTIGGSKLLDISPISMGSSKQSAETHSKKRSRLEGLVSKIANHSDDVSPLLKECAVSTTTKHASKTLVAGAPQLDSETSCPPPGVFEPSVELEIQIPPIAKLAETTSVVTKSEVESPLLIDVNKPFTASATKAESARVVESLLNKTGGNLVLRRKRKKFNRTGFPTVRRKKRKINEHLLLDITPDIAEQVQKVTRGQARAAAALTPVPSAATCDRVPQAGEASDSFLERASRTPRLSVVALERLQSTPTPTKSIVAAEATAKGAEKLPQQTDKARPLGRKKRVVPSSGDTTEIMDTNSQQLQPQRKLMKPLAVMATETVAVGELVKPARGRGRKPNAITAEKLQLVKDETTTIPASATASATKPTKSKDKNGGINVGASIPVFEQPMKKSTIVSPLKSVDKPPFSKSSVQKIITAKSLETKVKLPAGIDPNTNFSCKIRLKRRTALHSLLLATKEKRHDANNINNNNNNNNNNYSKNNKDEMQPTAEEVAIESAAKDASCDHLEHDVLPSIEVNGIESETSYDTSDEKSTVATAVRKIARFRKTYLHAGLFSDYYKTEQSVGVMLKPLAPPRKADKKLEDGTVEQQLANAEVMPVVATPLLPPPPYCERHFRRQQTDFLLPYDIWWAYKNSKLPSRNTVPSWNYRKIRTNVYADSVRPNMAGFDHPTCNCKADTIGCGDNCLNRMVYTECSPSSCPTRDKCTNQKIQRHEVAPGVERFMTENKGWGVRTKLPIAKGTYILEYVGEVVTEREFKDRMAIIYLNDTHHYCLHLDGGLVIDGHRMGSDGRFVNHSCQPNCEMQKWSVNGLSRMALFAKRNIEEGEELTYDYNFSLFNPSEGQPCRCNTPQCRGVIGGKSQRVKPLPIEAKPNEASPKDGKDGRNGRQRKRKARKNTQRLHAKDVVVARVQQLTEKEKKLVKQHGVFLVRNFEKIRRVKAKHATANEAKMGGNTPPPGSPNNLNNTGGMMAGAIISRRPSTPSSLAAQISALCSQRNIKTRGLTLAGQDPEVEKMAKMAVILRDICAALELLKDPNDEKLTLMSLALNAPVGGAAVIGAASGANNKKKKALKPQQKQDPIDLRTIQMNIEQGYYKLPSEFDEDMQKIFADARQLHNEDDAKLKALDTLMQAYERQKHESYAQLHELIGDDIGLGNFKPAVQAKEKPIVVENEQQKRKEGEIDTGKVDVNTTELKEQQSKVNAAETPLSTTLTEANSKATLSRPTETSMPQKLPGQAVITVNSSSEDIIRCICGLYKDEGLMIQCARCMVWQHTECTKADVNADNYLCERCEPRDVDREIPLEDSNEEGHRYYLTLMRGELLVRQGDAVYVLRDIPIKDNDGNIIPQKKHTYETIGHIDYNECDIFRVERLWKNDEGKRFIFGHHFLRPHETFHEPSRRFYPNEVVRVPLYEVVPIELVIGRCWVLDRTTFCKGRPIECEDDEHCYICELRVDKSARFFSKAKINYPTCTKSYAFRKFVEKLRISKSYAPHEVDPSMLKTKKQKTDIEAASTISSSSTTTTPIQLGNRQELTRTPANTRKRHQSYSPAMLLTTQPTVVLTVKQKRAHLENVLKTMKNKWKNTQLTLTQEPPIDLSYLLSGRGARQRKT